MNLQSLASHTVDLDLLPEEPTVLDVGCRWFDFTKAVAELRPASKVFALDPAEDVTDGLLSFKCRDLIYREIALVGSGNATQMLAHFSTGEGDFLTKQRHWDGWDKQPEIYEVDCMTIGELMLAEAVQHWDLVKLDCEGSEFDILEHWPGPIATQISVEFHDWDKPMYRSETYYDTLRKKLPWYKFAQHEFSKQGTGVGHWDSLLVLKNGK